MDEQMNDKAEFLKKILFFQSFDADDLLFLSENCEPQTFELGETILQRGEIPKGLYLVRSGRVRIYQMSGGKEKSVGLCKPGETFGELSLIRDETTEISVRSSGDSELLFFSKPLFRELSARNPSIKEHLTRQIVIKTCGNIIIPMFHLRSCFSADETHEIIKEIGIQRIFAQTEVLRKDDIENRNLYIVRSGRIRIVYGEENQTQTLRTYGPGEMFGEKTSLTDAPQPASAEAIEDSVLLVVPRKTVRHIVERNPGIRKVLDKRILALDEDLDRARSLSDRRRFLYRIHPKGFGNRRLIRRFSLIRQMEATDCGAACLRMICKHYQIPVSTAKLIEMTKVSAEGASLDSIVRAGETLGFEPHALKTGYQSLTDNPLPLIAHWEGHHYVVVYGISKSHVWLADPAQGFKKISRTAFERGWTGYVILFSPPESTEAVTEQRSPWKRFLNYLKPLKKHLADILFAAFIIQALGLVPPVIIQNILDRVVVHQSFSLLNIMLTGLAIAMFFKMITGFVSTYLMNFIIRKLDFKMMSSFYRHVLSLPLDFFVKRKTGDIVARFNENNTVRRFLTQGSISTILNAVMVLTYFIVMYCYNARLTLLLMAFLPPIILVTLLAIPKYKDYARRIFYAGADAQSLLVETLTNAEVVKGMGTESPLRMKWEKKYADTLNIRYRASIFSAFIGLVSSALQAGTHLTLLWVGTGMVLNQELTIGQLMAFNALIGSVMAPVMGLVGIWDEFQQTMVSMERLGDLLELSPEQKTEEANARMTLPQIKGGIRFEKVYFRYGGKEQPYILKNIHLDIRPGETLAIVGHSGSGKTTLARLLAGFYKPEEGKILIDGYDINLLDMASYRTKIGYVLQDNTLFSGTITDNIAIGDSEPDLRKVHEAARLADADDFIRNLPNSYEQVVGERGMGLSGGQIQRICIARALYNDPGLLILDEATSSLDTASELRIRNNMKQILEGRTAVVIAHRLSTIKDADQIVVLYEGGIAESGDHEELIQRKGMYYELVCQQGATELAA